MKINIANPATGQQKYIVVDDEKRLRSLYDKRISNEVDGSDLGSEYEGYVFRISGGNDKQGFAMKQGVLSNGRVRLLLSEGSSGYRTRRVGERKRKSVRGCIVGSDLSVLNLVVLRQGANQIEGLTDVPQPIRLGPKRASKIRALFNLSKEDKVTDNVICREFKNKKGKDVKKRPKVQRLVTPVTLKRKRVRLAEKVNSIKKSRDSAAVYTALLQSRLQEQNEARKSEISKRRSSRKASQKE